MKAKVLGAWYRDAAYSFNTQNILELEAKTCELVGQRGINKMIAIFGIYRKGISL